MIYSLLFSAVLSAPQGVRPAAPPAVVPPFTGFKGVNVGGPEFGTVVPGVSGKDYFFDTSAKLPTMKSYADAKLDAFRIPFKWERMQPVLGGALDPKYLKEYTDALAALPAKSTIIVDCHNYGNFKSGYIGIPGSSVTNAHFADLWVKLGTALKTCTTCIFGLMNEPTHSPDPLTLTEEQWGASWANSSAYAANAMRKAGISQKIAITGIGYSKPHTYAPSQIPTDKALVGLANMVIEFHVYYDELFAPGANILEQCKSFPEVLKIMEALTVSMRGKKQQAFIGEFATNRQKGCIDAAQAIADHIRKNADVWIGIVAWGGGEHYAPLAEDGISLLPAEDGSLSPMLKTILPSLTI